MSFSQLDLPQPLTDALTDLGFDTPTDIQRAAIPVLLDGRDVVGIAQTGTGKTAAFALPILARLNHAQTRPQALILAPTRELALQCSRAFTEFASHLEDFRVASVYGGASYSVQIRALRTGVHVVVGTPGRVIDLMERGVLDLSGIRTVVLDEADEMLSMGFAEDVDQILAATPPAGERITALFSATMPESIQRIARTHLVDPVDVSVSVESTTVDTVDQTFAVVPFKHKLAALARVLGVADEDAAIVFVRTRADAELVALDLTQRGFNAAAISGDVSQKERELIVSRLRDGALDILVATDVAARGLDVDRVGLVVNFDVPREPAAYVHRIGRTGRAGRRGRSVTFFTPSEHFRLTAITALTGTAMKEIDIPSPESVIATRVRRALDVIVHRGSADSSATTTSPYRAVIADAVTEYLSDADVSEGDIVLALLGDRIGRVVGGADDRRGHGRVRREEELDDNGAFVRAVFEPDRRAKTARSSKKCRASGERGSSRSRAGRPTRPTSPGFPCRYRVEVGKRDGVKPAAIVGAITGEGGLSSADLGRIDIFPTFSLVEMSGELSTKAARRISRATIRGRQLRIREDTGPQRAREHHHREDN